MRTFLSAIVLLTAILAPARVASARESEPHVRALDSCATSIMANALARSSTVRTLGDRLAQSDVVAYVRCVWPEPGSPVGSLVWVGGDTLLRYVLIRLSHDLSPERRVQMLGHEMQHALEVADARWVRDEATLRRLFEQIGRRTSAQSTFETAAAVLTERTVRLELTDTPPPPLPANLVLADPTRPATVAASGLPPSEGGSLAAGPGQQGLIRVGVFPQVEEGIVALQALGRLAERGVRPGLPKQGERIKD